MTTKQVLNRIQETMAECNRDRMECENIGDIETVNYIDGKLYAYKHCLALLTRKGV